jgi:TP901 family phage tail tape measure protein
MTFKTIEVALTARVGQFRAEMASAAAEVRLFGAQVTEVAGRTDAQTRQVMATAGRVSTAIGVGVVAAFALSAKASIDFERQMRNVNTISQMSEAQFRSTGAAVVDMSRQMPQSASTLARGLYDIASSGFQGSAGMEVLRASAVAASAGLSDTATASRAITAVLNAYGMSAGQASHVSDVLFQTVNKGVLTFEELANTVGDFVGATAAAHIPIEDASAAIATMTLSGLSAAESGTSLTRVVQSLMRPSDALALVLRQQGYESGVAALQAKGLSGVMDMLRTATGGSLEMVVKMFPEMRSARGALALTAQSGRLFAEQMAAIKDPVQAAGAAQRAFDIQSKGLGFQIEITKNNVMALAIQTGNMLLPVLRSAAGSVKSLADGFAGLSGPARTIVTVVVGLGGAIALLGGGFLLLAPRIVAARKLMEDLAKDAPRVASGIGAATSALGYLTPALLIASLMLTHYAAEKEKARQATQGFVDAIMQEQQGVQGSVNTRAIQSLAEKGAIDRLIRLKVSTVDATGAIQGNQAAVDRLAQSLAAQVTGLDGNEKAMRLLHDALNGSNTAYNDLLNLMASGVLRGEHAGDVMKIVRTVGDLSDANSSATKAVRENTAATNEHDAAGKKVATTSAQLSEQQRQLAAMFDQTTGSAQGLTAAEQALFDAVGHFIDPMQVFADLQSQADEAQKKSAQSTKSTAQHMHDAARNALDYQSAVLGVAQAQGRLEDASRKLAQAQSDKGYAALRQAERDLATAVDDTTRARERELDAEQRLADLRHPSAKTVRQGELDVESATIAATRATADQAAAEAKLADTRAAGGSDDAVAAAELDVRDARVRAEEAALHQADAERALADLRSGGSARDVRDAELDIAAAKRDVAAADDAAAAKQAAVNEMRDGGHARDLAAAEQALAEAVLGVKQAHEQVIEVQDRASQSNDSVAASTDHVKLSLDEYQAALQKQVDEENAWEANLVTIARRGGFEVASEFAKLGRDHADIVTKMANATDEQFGRMASTMKTATDRGVLDHQNSLDAGLKQATVIAELEVGHTVDAIATKLKLGQGEVQQISDEYALDLMNAANAVLAATTGEKIYFDQTTGEYHMPGGVKVKAEGGFDPPHTAQVAHTARLWAEPETGGEAYIPLAPSKRARSAEILGQVAGHFGMRLAAYAQGGVLPPPPDLSAWGWPLRAPAETAANIEYAAMRALAGQGRSPAPGAPGQIRGDRWPAITAYLDGRHVPYVITSTTGGRHAVNSYHYRGKAVDMVSSDMRQIATALLDARAQLAEMFYDPLGQYVKDGRLVRGAIGGHSDHVHAAVFDRGGYLPPGLTMAWNGTGAPERVVGPGGGGAVTVHAPLTVTVHTSANVDERAFEGAVRRAVEPALAAFAADLEAELTAAGA